MISAEGTHDAGQAVVGWGWGGGVNPVRLGRRRTMAWRPLVVCSCIGKCGEGNEWAVGFVGLRVVNSVG